VVVHFFLEKERIPASTTAHSQVFTEKKIRKRLERMKNKIYYCSPSILGFRYPKRQHPIPCLPNR
jgi:hypothetical protein